MSGFYGHRRQRQSKSTACRGLQLGNEESRTRGSARDFSAARPPPPGSALPYTPGMYLQDHPEARSQLSPSDSDFEENDPTQYRADTQLMNPEDNRLPLTSDGPSSSFHSVYTTPSSAERVFTPPSAGRDMAFASQQITPCGPHVRGVNRPRNDLTSLLQQQQATLESILNNQKSMQEKQSQMESKLLDLEMKINSPQSTSSSSSSSSKSSGKRKQIISRELSNKISKVHAELDDGECFKPEESSASTHNKAVQKELLSQVIGQPDNKYQAEVVKAAIKRCYENLRRTYVEQGQGKEEYVENQSKRRKYRSRRQRTFEKRTLVVTEREMDMYWKHLSQAYMTEESDDPENPDNIIQHKLPWRSQKLNDYIAILEQRRDKRGQRDVSGLVAKKTRTLGASSTSEPPPSAPSWAVNREEVDGRSIEDELNL